MEIVMIMGHNTERKTLFEKDIENESQNFTKLRIIS